MKKLITLQNSILLLTLELRVFSTVKHNVMIKLFIVQMSCVYIGTLKCMYVSFQLSKSKNGDM